MKTAVVNRIVNEKGEILFLLRANKPFGLCLAGGKIDEGETHLDACLRETKEETGIDLKTMMESWDILNNHIYYIGETVAFDGTQIHVYETVLDHTPAVVRNPREHLSNRWLKVYFTDMQSVIVDFPMPLVFAGHTMKFVTLNADVNLPNYLSVLTEEMVKHGQGIVQPLIATK